MTEPAPATLADRFRALRHRNFRLFWSGQLVSVIGTWMQSVAQGWLMHRLTNSAWMLGVLGFEDATVRYHVQRFAGKRKPLFTVVGRRTVPLSD